MFRYKTNKQAIVIAALVILLCFTCLMGATLALFTNDPNDGTIGIITTTGRVEVDIVDEYTGASLKGQTLQFQTSLEQDKIYFEPGAMFVTQGFKIKNEGDIPIYFELSVSDDEVIGREDFKSAFDVWLSTDDSTRPETIVDIDEFVGFVDPKTDSADTYFLYVKMKETADDRFQGDEYSGIGITVLAVQANAEEKE